MNFQNLNKVETADWYLNLAFRNANKAATLMKDQMRQRPDTIKKAELEKISTIRNLLHGHLNAILKSFPTIDELPEFYQELVKVTLEHSDMKHSFGAVNWAVNRIDQFSDSYSMRIKKCGEFSMILRYSREYYGRISSVVKKIKKELVYLEHARRTMKGYPSIKTSVFTVAIAGFPNVGKTTLLSKLTGSTPEIANYAFTTKNLNVGYTNINNTRVQFIDTPGTLNRFEKMNPIEQQAYLAIKHCANLIVFVFDPSEQAYGAKDQMELIKSLKKFDKDMIIYVSKTDLPEGNIPGAIKSGKKCFIDIESLKNSIGKFLKDFSVENKTTLNRI